MDTESGSELQGALRVRGWGTLAHSGLMKEISTSKGQEVVETEVGFKSIFSHCRSFLEGGLSDL